MLKCHDPLFFIHPGGKLRLVLLPLFHGLFLSVFLFQLINILRIYPLFAVAAAAAQVSVHQNGGKNSDTGLYVVAGAVTADITFDFDNIRSVLLGTNMCIFHIDSSHTRIS